MNEEKININEIVKIESMAVIKTQLDAVEKMIDEKVKNIPEVIKKIKKMSFEEQEDEKSDIKKYQQYLSNLQKQLEDKRKELKKEINKPYDEFNEYYSNGVYLKLNNGIQQIKEVVNEIETLQKDEKELELKEFANEYFNSYNIQDFVTFEKIGLNITLSASIKSLKDQIINFCKKVEQDLNLIELEEYKNEILVEYKNNLDFAKSKVIVYQRHKDLEEVMKKNEEIKIKQEQEQNVIQEVEKIIENNQVENPKEIEESKLNEEILIVAFKITATRNQIKELKQFLVERGIKYE